MGRWRLAAALSASHQTDVAGRREADADNGVDRANGGQNVTQMGLLEKWRYFLRKKMI